MQDLEFQIGELRTALAKEERKAEKQEDLLAKKIDETNAIVTALEKEIAELGRRFSEPLRQKPELRSLFNELDSDAA